MKLIGRNPPILGFSILMMSFWIGCAQNGQPKQTESTSGEIANVHVTAAGVITLNQREVSLDQLKQEFARLAAAGGTVRYSRENPTADPHPNAMEVIKAVIAAGLPIQMLEQ